MAWRIASVSLILTVVFAIANVEADLTSTQKMQLLNTHNAVRRSVQPPATDIKTMVVWANSDSLGCGVTRCANLRDLPSFKNALIVVCNYGPSGNFIGEKPYRTTRRRSLDSGELLQEADSFVDDENQTFEI
eukprot:Em0021g750a